MSYISIFWAHPEKWWGAFGALAILIILSILLIGVIWIVINIWRERK